MPRTFYIGCTHFGHANIIKLAGRPFADVDQMNEAMVENWNRAVGPDDTVYHLGDVCFPNAHVTNWLARLNGKIITVLGNHDREVAFTKIRPTAQYMEVSDAGRRLVLFHYPIQEWNGWFKGAWHLHCHTHDHRVRTADRRINVSVEAIGYTPRTLDELQDLYARELETPRGC